MSFLQKIAMCALCIDAFSPPSYSDILSRQLFINGKNQQQTNILFSTTDSKSEAEALLRKARELRAEAEAAETELHTNLVQKKASEDAETDRIIEELFPFPDQDENDAAIMANRLKQKRVSTPTLIKVVERLHEREVIAKGVEHVEPSVHHNHVKFERVVTPNTEELSRVVGLVDKLIAGATILDEDFAKEQNAKGGEVVKHADANHWTPGDLSKILKERVHYLEREHDEQFQHRLEEYYDAALKKN
mmetsp:Transcript_53145/g.64017  ORF Transcript_53145/g.64017 Transcript_53145/m.64017 type:complete len:247 (+) Transcript_53145:52-792(+)|eukprot:CAMPEP_0172510358 /NCGR_PEP_ID=MMETSP1066-20121228/227793_1 /TAXON_ID=671091 /ORGANISM="Coscinodiscus wailesii, Strain CCMP2513" /LENGTH=246 /DNA_ID=CAMNT_0013289271 /DNA_START=26 /DNA_END=769 /DNA_ORIENTATION=+